MIKRVLRDLLHEFWNSNMNKEDLFNKVYDTLGDSNPQAIVLHLMSKFDPDVINRYQYAVALLLGNQHPAAHDYVAVFEQEHLWVRTHVVRKNSFQPFVPPYVRYSWLGTDSRLVADVPGFEPGFSA